MGNFFYLYTLLGGYFPGTVLQEKFLRALLLRVLYHMQLTNTRVLNMMQYLIAKIQFSISLLKLPYDG